MTQSSGWSTPGSNPPPGSTTGSGPGDPAWSPAGGDPDWGSPPPGPGWGPPGGDQGVQRPGPPSGVIPLRPLALGEILDAAFSLVRRHARVTLAWSAVILVIGQLLTVGVGLLDGSLSSALNATGTGTLLGTGQLGGRLVSLAVSAATGGVLTGVLAVIVADAVLGSRPSFSTVWQRVRPHFLRLLAVAILAGVLPWLGLLLLVVPGIFLWGVLALATPALVLERLTVRGALRRSWRLAVPDWWRVFGIHLLAVLIAGAVAAVLVVPAGLVGGLATRGVADTGAMPLGALAIIAVLAVAASILTQPFVAAVVVLLYVDRRMRAEGLDVALVAATAQGSAGPDTGPGAGPSAGWSGADPAPR